MEDASVKNPEPNPPEQPNPPSEPKPGQDPADMPIPSGETPPAERVRLLEEENADLRNQVLRAIAETRTVQSRMRQEMQELRTLATERLVVELLPVLDNLERAMRSAELEPSAEKLAQGVAGIDRQLRRVLHSVALKRIEAVGKPFDPNLHEAVDTHATHEHEHETVVAELEAGYTLGGKVIRPARVRVATKPE